MYTPEERAIFKYKVGTKTTCADPNVLYRRFRKKIDGEYAGLDIQKAWKLAFGESEFTPAFEEIEEAISAIMDIACFTLGTHKLDANGDGMTESEAVGNFSAFLDYIDELKKKAENSSNSSASAGDPPSDPITPASTECS